MNNAAHADTETRAKQAELAARFNVSFQNHRDGGWHTVISAKQTEWCAANGLTFKGGIGCQGTFTGIGGFVRFTALHGVELYTEVATGDDDEPTAEVVTEFDTLAEALSELVAAGREVARHY